MRTSPNQPATPPARSGPARTAAVAAAAALLALGAAACGGSTTSGASPAGTGPSTPASTPGGGQATAAPPGSAAGPATRTPAGVRPTAGRPGQSAHPTAAPDRCTVTDLRMTLGGGDPGAGNIYYPLRFTNTSGHPCTLDGFPGVSLIRGDGSTIGRPADRESDRAAAVRLAPGQSVEADLHTLNQGIRGGDCWRKPTFLKVYPPGSTDAMTLAASSPLVCGDTFDVGPVH
jgi:hypothetical protein